MSRADVKTRPRWFNRLRIAIAAWIAPRGYYVHDWDWDGHTITHDGSLPGGGYVIRDDGRADA